MKRLISRAIVLSGIAMGTWAALSNESTTHAQEPTTSPSTTQPGTSGGKRRELAPFKRPGKSGAAQGAISGGSRGPDDPPIPIPFAPQDQPGLTATDRPVILFYVPKPAKGPAVFTIFDTAKAKPKLIEITFDEGFTTPGVQRVDLSKHNAPLKPGQVYQWNVTIPNKPGGGGGGAGGGANDGFAAGHIKYDESKTTVRDQWKSAPPADRAVAFADAGLWYDALAALAEAIDQNPTDPTLVEQRNMWLSSENIAVPN